MARMDLPESDSPPADCGAQPDQTPSPQPGERLRRGVLELAAAALYLLRPKKASAASSTDYRPDPDGLPSVDDSTPPDCGAQPEIAMASAGDQVCEMRPYSDGEALSARVSISAFNVEAGSPKPGDWIARNPKNHADQWLVAEMYFRANWVGWGFHVGEWRSGTEMPPIDHTTDHTAEDGDTFEAAWVRIYGRDAWRRC